MTENEAKNIIFAQAECEAREHNCDKDKCDECELLYMQGTVAEHREALNMAIQALEETQEYRRIGLGSPAEVEQDLLLYKADRVLVNQYSAIGTVEEFKALKEKAEPKKPSEIDEREEESFYYLAFICPTCETSVTGQPYRPNYCKHCGQRLDWS